MYGTETAYHRFFEKYFRVYDPWEADLFFVPSYFKCIKQMNWLDEFSKEDKNFSFEEKTKWLQNS